jgi:hypothetical protein
LDVSISIYTMAAMASKHHSLRVPRWLWDRYALVVGSFGRGPDLNAFILWQIDNPDVTLGEDVAPPNDFLATFLVEEDAWGQFSDIVGAGDYSSRLRAYVWWQVRNGGAPLPGRLDPPQRRPRQSTACV